MTITEAEDDAAARQADERNKGIIFTNCNCNLNYKSEINNIDKDNAKDIDIIMVMCNVIEFSGNNSKVSGSLWQYYNNEPSVNLIDSKSYKSKTKTTANGNTIDSEIIVPLKWLSNFWRNLEMALIIFEINLILTWPSTWVISNSAGEGGFSMAETKLYVPVVTLLTQDNAKFLQQSKSAFKKAISWNKYQSDPKIYEQNQYLNHLIDTSFQGVNRLFELSFENENGRTSNSGYYLPKVEIKDKNITFDGNFFLISQ